MLSKIKGFIQAPRKKNYPHEPQDEGPYHTDPSKNNQLSPSGLNQGKAAPSAVMTKSHKVQDKDLRGGPFTGAHDFTIVNAYMNNGGQTEEDRRAEQERRAKEERRAEEEREERKEECAEREKRAKEEREADQNKKEEKALKKLAEKGIPGAMLDSKDRGYTPRCNPDTRQALRRRIVEWGRNDEETRRLLWLSGPAGVGKSAVAQTVAEELEKERFLGAVFFFSRPNDRSDPDVVIPTLAYQLALLLPEYRRIITQRLITDPLVLKRSRASEFKELIIDPFLTLTSYRPLLIVLDGLDECKDRDARCEFVEMISYYARKEKNLRLRWMISSRPEPDLKVSFSSEDCKATCIEVKIEVDDSEAQRDAMRILETGFANIRRRYPDHVTGDWPADDQVRFIADRASGHLGFVSFILRFIGDKDYDDPSGQLDVCLKFLRRTGDSMNVNPLLALDLLYTQILSDIPTNILPTTQRILGLFIFYDNRYLTAAAHANFLGLDQATFYRSLQRLHSVLLVPSASDADKKPIQIYHASFSDYLKDQIRSEKFYLEEDVVPYFNVAISGLKWLGYGHNDRSKRLRPQLTWIPSRPSRENVFDSLCRFSFTPCWKACINVPEDLLPALFEALEKFDFNLNYSLWWGKETKDFAYFVRWLATSDNQHKALVTAKDGHEKEIKMWHQDDPDTFAAPFSEDIRPWGPRKLHFRVGRKNPASFFLRVDHSYEPEFS